MVTKFIASLLLLFLWTCAGIFNWKSAKWSMAFVLFSLVWNIYELTLYLPVVLLSLLWGSQSNGKLPLNITIKEFLWSVLPHMNFLTGEVASSDSPLPFIVMLYHIPALRVFFFFFWYRSSYKSVIRLSTRIVFWGKCRSLLVISGLILV